MARLQSRLLTALAAAALVTLLVLSGLTWRADAWVFDALTRQASHRVDDRVLLVEIDEKSLTELGRWPWSRRIHAQLVDRLADAGVQGVALNILLSDPALFDPEGDALLARALSGSGNVVLPVYAEAAQPGGAVVELVPIPEFAASATLGHVDMAVDEDGMARSMFLRAGLGEPHWPSLALALSRQGAGDAAGDAPPGERIAQDRGEDTVPRWKRDYRVLIPYADPPDAFKRVSYTDVLNGRVPDSDLRGRWALVDITAAGMDTTPAPTEALATTEPRVSEQLYQANALGMLVRHAAIVPLSLPGQVLLSVALTLLPLLLFGLPRLKKIWQPILVAVLSVVVATCLLLRFGQAWFPPVSALCVLGAGALFWLVRMLRQSRRQAQTDPFTGLANRIRFDLALEQEIQAARRNRQPLSLLLIDIDHFKPLNDSHGATTGDQVLHALTNTLRGRARRPRDLVARLGGDEFALLLPETTAPAAAAIATTIHVDLANHSAQAVSGGNSAPFTVSIGIHTTRSGDQVLAEDMFEHADAALYRAKQTGRNRSCSHTSESGFASS